MKNILFCNLFPPGASRVDQTHKFDDFLDLTQFFHIQSDSVLIEIKFVGNYILNNLYLHDKLPILHCYPSWSFWSWQTHKVDDFLDFKQFCQIWPDSVLIEIVDVNNVIYSNFECHDQLLKMQCFLSGTL